MVDPCFIFSVLMPILLGFVGISWHLSCIQTELEKIRRLLEKHES